MAYNSGWDPDALPAHAEPEQAAQLFAKQQQEKAEAAQQTQAPPQRPSPDARNYSGPPPQRTSPRPYANSNPQSYNDPRANYQNNPLPPLPPAGGNYAQNASSYNYNHSPPPPRGYQQGPPPPPQDPMAGRRPSPPSRPPLTPAPPGRGGAGGDASLFPLFKAVDKSGTGHLTERELGKALVNGDFTQFDSHTVKMMIRMFDVDKNGSINFDEFSALWGFLAAWRGLFDRFDEDRSGYISFDEYTNALVAFGYRLSSTFVHLLYSTYDKGGKGEMSFDLFVQSCIILKRMTDVFKKYDEDRDGYITLSFEEFLTEILRQR